MSGLVWTKHLACPVSYEADKDLRVNGQVLKAEVAKTQQQLARGLGGRSCIGENQVMLFEFGSPGYYPFWMKDMRFNIDIVWLDQAHRVVDIKKQATPASYPQRFTNHMPAQDVLELKAGRAGQLGLSKGTAIAF
jgi:uncharacterized protein